MTNKEEAEKAPVIVPQEASVVIEEPTPTNVIEAPVSDQNTTSTEDESVEVEVDEEAPKKSLDEINLGENVKEIFKQANEKGLSQAEIVEDIRTRLVKAGYDTTDLTERLAPFTKEFGNLNLSSNDFFKGLAAGETYGSFYEKNSVDYQQAKVRWDAFNAVDKTEQGIRALINSGALDKNQTLLKDLMNDERTAPFVKQNMKEVLKDKAKNTKNI
jgi:hypothetical protein